MTTPLQEPSIPEKFKRPLAALWISLGLHGAVLALVQIASPIPVVTESVIEARLESVSPPVKPLRLTPAEVDDAPARAVPAPKEVEPAPDAASSSTTTPQAARPASTIPRLEIPVAVDLTYYTARELDEQPHELSPIVPAYPEAADRQHLSGTVRLKLKIEETGVVSSVELLDAHPPEIFELSALTAFRDARLAPAIKDGRPVRALIVIEVQFDYEGRLLPADGQRKIQRQ